MTQEIQDITAAETMLAIEEIKQLKAAYCRLVDTKDFVGWARLFAPDARVDEGEFPIARDPLTGERIPDENFSFEFLEGLTAEMEWPLVGREAIERFGTKITAGVISAHHVFTPEIRLESPTTASAIWPMEDYVWFSDEAPVSYMHGVGHYHETYTKLEDGRWYFQTIDLTRLKVEWR